jgi:serine/threonine-protein phosphatase 2A regulatory subunit A
VSQATLQGVVLPFLLQFAYDPVPNIRFNLAKAIAMLALRLDATTKAAGGELRRVLDSLSQDAGQQDVQYYAIKALAAL